MTIGECASHAKVAAQIGPVGGKGSSEQALARRMFGRLEEDWLLIAHRGFYARPDWRVRRDRRGAAVAGESRSAAAGAGAAARRLLPVGRGQAGPAGQCPEQADRRRPRGRVPRSRPGDAGAGHRVRDPRPRRRRQRRADRPGHHHHRPRRLHPPRNWPRPTASGGKRKPATTSSRPACGGPER